MFRCRQIAGLLVIIPIAAGIGGCRWFGGRPEVPEPPPEADQSEGSGIRRQLIRTPLACVRNGEVWLMDGDGNKQRRVAAPGRAIPESLRWSADAARLAFWTVEEGENGRTGPFRLCAASTQTESAAGAPPAGAPPPPIWRAPGGGSPPPPPASVGTAHSSPVPGTSCARPSSEGQTSTALTLAGCWPRGSPAMPDC